MEEIVEQKHFNYSLIDEETAAFLKQKETVMKEIVGNAYTLLGKELKEAQDKLAKNGYGCFQEWYESLGFKKTTVYRLIQKYDLIVSNWDKQELIEALPKSLVYEIAKPSADSELKQQVLDGDITSHKKYKQLEKEKKELEERLEFVKEVNETAVQEKELERERKLALKKKLEQSEEQIRVLENNPMIPDEIESRLQELEERAGELDRHKAEINNYNQKKNKLYEEIDQLHEYKRQLEEENDVVAQRAEVVQGIRSEINSFRKSQGRIEQLIKKDVQLRDVDLYNINDMADFLNEMADKLYQFVASQKSHQEGEVIDVQ